MKIKLLGKLKYFFPVVIFFLTFNFSLAAPLELHKIGALDLGGNTYSEWWYTGASPILSGIAETGSPVNIKIGDATFTATPDATGAWSSATTLENGDHNIEITQGENKIVFLLHLGQNVPSNFTTSGSAPAGATEVPETGFNQYVALSFGMGIILLATYLYFSSDSMKKTVFESRMLKED